MKIKILKFKKVIFTGFAGCLLSLTLNLIGQDIITKINGEDIKSKVIEVGIKEIKYQRSDNLSGPIYIISKDEVFSITYPSGVKDVFTNPKKNIINDSVKIVNPSNVDFEQQGRDDAQKYYKNYRGAMTGTLLLTGFCSPFIGGIASSACRGTRPKESSLTPPSKILWGNPIYKKAYCDEAYKIKRRKVGNAFGGGIFLCIGVVAATLGIVFSTIR